MERVEDRAIEIRTKNLAEDIPAKVKDKKNEKRYRIKMTEEGLERDR